MDTSSGTTFGSVAIFSCNTGYKLSHQQGVVCGANGMWSSASPSCLSKILMCGYSCTDCFKLQYLIVIDCGFLNDPDNGRVDTSNGTTFGSIVTYICSTGYTLSGSQSGTCRADGHWTLQNPSCLGENEWCQ